MTHRGPRGFAARSPRRGRLGRGGPWALGVLALLAGCAEPPAEPGREARAIIGGVEAPGWPEVGALVELEPGLGVVEIFCTATLVDRAWAVTSASCVAGRDPKATLLYFGPDARPDGAGRPTEGSLHVVDAFLLHPGYAAPDHDLALAHLSEPLEGAATVALSSQPLGPEVVGQALLHVGFGEADGAGVAGAGVKRSTSLSVDAVTAAVFMSQYRGSGLCYADLGGPALAEAGGAYSLVGVSSALSGGVSPCEGVYYSQRIDAHVAWLLETIGGPGPSCLDDRTMCHCSAACTSEGSCDDAVCHVANCAEIYACVFECAGPACALDCYLTGVDAARDDYDALFLCAKARCESQTGEAYQACLEAECGEPLAACFPIQSGSLTCEEVYGCIAECPPADPGCNLDCYHQGSVEAQGQLDAMLGCFQDECGHLGDDAFAACVEQRCGPEIAACLPSEACDLEGGDCPPGAACAPTVSGGTACLPSEDLAVGSACEAQDARLPCADGAFCVQGACAVVCTAAEACGPDEACVRPIFAALPEYGVCQVAPDAGVSPRADAGVEARADAGASSGSAEGGGCHDGPSGGEAGGLGLLGGLLWFAARRGRRSTP